MNRPLGGHEAAGEVVEIGPGVSMVKPGDRVVVMPQSGCGVCDLCTSGDHIYCPDKKNAREICGNETGTSTLGQYCVQQDWLLVPIPDDHFLRPRQHGLLRHGSRFQCQPDHAVSCPRTRC